MACGCNKAKTEPLVNKLNNSKFEKLSLDSVDNTKIMAGYATFSIKQLEEEINTDSEIGKKLKSVEAELDKY